MLELLDKWPQAIVGEIGIDRSAKVPGTSSSKASEHQWSLFKDQMDIAAQHNRPVLLLPLHRRSCDTPCIIPTSTDANLATIHHIFTSRCQQQRDR